MLFSRKVKGHPVGLFLWRRSGWRAPAWKAGIVLRAGPIGHVQVYAWSGIKIPNREGARHKHGVAVAFWGVRNRRRKRVLELAVHL